MSGWSSNSTPKNLDLSKLAAHRWKQGRSLVVFPGGIQPHQLSPGAMKILGLKVLPCCLCLKVRFWQSYSLRSDLMTKGEHRNGLSPCLKIWFWQSYSLCSLSEDLGVGFGTVVHDSENLVLTDLLSVTPFENEKRCMSPPWPMPWYWKQWLTELLSINSSVVSVLVHNLLCHLTQWFELNRNTFCYTFYEVQTKLHVSICSRRQNGKSLIKFARTQFRLMTKQSDSQNRANEFVKV